MHLRRALLLFALVLGLTALAASIAPGPKSSDRLPVPSTGPEAPTPAGEDGAVMFSAPPPGRRPPARRMVAGSHVTVVVAGAVSGEADIPRLGLTQPVTVDAPAQFDLIVPDPGRYGVRFTPTDGTPLRVGTLVSRPAAG